jgi:hypothetical protein
MKTAPNLVLTKGQFYSNLGNRQGYSLLAGKEQVPEFFHGFSPKNQSGRQTHHPDCGQRRDHFHSDDPV